MSDFLDPASTSLKICGVTRSDDAERLVELGVHALGINFWPHSKRYLAPESAKTLLEACASKIVRVGVFVNAEPELPRSLLENGYIDIAQFHGDETPDYCKPFAEAKLPFIKAIGVKNKQSLANITDYGASAILLDTPAPGVYGGTGETFEGHELGDDHYHHTPGDSYEDIHKDYPGFDDHEGDDSEESKAEEAQKDDNDGKADDNAEAEPKDITEDDADSNSEGETEDDSKDRPKDDDKDDSKDDPKDRSQ